jgi:hypothetical protein
MLRVLSLAVMVAALQACTLLQQEDARLELAVKYSTLKTIERAELTGEQVRDGVARVRPLVEREVDITLGELVGEVRGVIRWDRLSPADQLLLDAVLGAIEAELQQRIGEGLLNPDDRAAIGAFLRWVDDAAAMS